MVNRKLPLSTRTAFTELMIHLWVAVHPYHELKVPYKSRLYHELATDPLLGEQEKALACASSAHMYNFQLLMFLTSDFFVNRDRHDDMSNFRFRAMIHLDTAQEWHLLTC